MDDNKKYAVISFDGGNGWVFSGIATGKVLNEAYPDASSRNDDGVFELDEEGSMLAVSTTGSEFVPEESEEDEDES